MILIRYYDDEKKDTGIIYEILGEYISILHLHDESITSLHYSCFDFCPEHFIGKKVEILLNTDVDHSGWVVKLLREE